MDRVSDVDLAVEITPKEPNKDRACALNERHVQILESLGRRLRGFLDRQFYWHREVFRFLKGPRDLSSGSQGGGRVRDGRAAPGPLCKRCLDGGRTATNQGPPSSAA